MYKNAMNNLKNIKRIKSEYIEKGTDPIISMDVKKRTIRELL